MTRPITSRHCFQRALLLCMAVAVSMVAVPAQAATVDGRSHVQAGKHHRSQIRPRRTWFVLSGAPAGGTGSRTRPFATLNAVQSASRVGDTIIVLPAPAGAPALDGGIVLKTRQILRGAGPSVMGRAPTATAPRITNTQAARNHGDTVVLADGVTVKNLAIVGSYRGAITGQDVNEVHVLANDITATNSSCTIGFVVQPFLLPTGLPGVGAPFSSGLPNGWAAVQLDARSRRVRVTVEGNRIHDLPCGDGIDVRAAGTARVTAHVNRSTITRIQQGSNALSVLAIGMQTTDTAKLVGLIADNTETYIGNATLGDLGVADSEGVFFNSAGKSRLTAYVDHNHFAHGLGHLSANCIETAASNGGPTMHIRLRNSDCRDVVGDIIELANLSPGATVSLDIDHVTATHSTYPASDLQHLLVPGDDGDCLLMVISGSASTTTLNINHSNFSQCAADGIGVVTNVVDSQTAPASKIAFSIRNSSITNSAFANLRVLNATNLTNLAGLVENTNLNHAKENSINVEQRYSARTQNTTLDFGGGALGSGGHNCIAGSGLTDATATGYDLSAQHNWWGNPAGPTALRASRRVDHAHALAAPPNGVC